MYAYCNSIAIYIANSYESYCLEAERVDHLHCFNVG